MKKLPRIVLDYRCVQPVLRRNHTCVIPVSNLDAGCHMIRSVHMNNCLAAQIRFLLFKGPGSFKTIFKIGGNVDE
jgi:hypothetical protein